MYILLAARENLLLAYVSRGHKKTTLNKMHINSEAGVEYDSGHLYKSHFCVIFVNFLLPFVYIAQIKDWDKA